MQRETRQIYRCDHCKKHYLNKGTCTYHEKICFKNPENTRPCHNCPHLTKKDAATTHYFYDGDEYERKLKVFYCDKKEMFLYPPQSEIRKNALDLPEGNDPMPKQCEIFDAIILQAKKDSDYLTNFMK
jgi:hypothetical protein